MEKQAFHDTVYFYLNYFPTVVYGTLFQSIKKLKGIEMKSISQGC